MESHENAAKAPEIKVSRDFALSQAPTLDPVGVMDDVAHLASDGWVVLVNNADYAVFSKHSGVLKLTGQPCTENPHRLQWELALNANDVQIGYASEVLRPGDMGSEATTRLRLFAIDSCRAAIARYNDALESVLNTLRKA